MPGLNGTGPRGFGPMTGRGFGLCTGFSSAPNLSYGYNQPMMPQLPYTYPNNMQNPYTSQTQSVMPAQQPYNSGFPFGMGFGRGLGWGRGFGLGRGFGMGMAFRRGMGWGGRGAYRFW
jgi:hypothetical protein